MSYFPVYKIYFSRDATFAYSIAISMEKCQDKIQSLPPPVQTCLARNPQAIYMRSNHIHFLHIPFIMRKFHLDSLSREIHICRADSRLYMVPWTLQSQPLQVGFNHYRFLFFFKNHSSHS